MNTKTSWTIAAVLKHRPCLSKTEIRRHFGSRRTLTLQQILDLPDLSDEHKVWMACRPGTLSTTCLTRWQVAVLTRAITTHALTCGVTAVEQWAARWLSGENRAAAGAADAAAWAANAARTAEYRQQILDLRAALHACRRQGFVPAADRSSS